MAPTAAPAADDAQEQLLPDASDDDVPLPVLYPHRQRHPRPHPRPHPRAPARSLWSWLHLSRLLPFSSSYSSSSSSSPSPSYPVSFSYSARHRSSSSSSSRSRSSNSHTRDPDDSYLPLLPPATFRAPKNGHLHRRKKRRRWCLFLCASCVVTVPLLLYSKCPLFAGTISSPYHNQGETESSTISTHGALGDADIAASIAGQNASDLLGSFLTKSAFRLVDPYYIASPAGHADALAAPPLDMDLPLRLKSGQAVVPASSSDMGGIPVPYSKSGDRVNPSVLFTPQWAAERSVKPISAYAAIMEDDDCLLQWVAQGSVCEKLQARFGLNHRRARHDPEQTESHTTSTENASLSTPSRTTAKGNPSHMPPIDVVFTWVNGSDPLHTQATAYWAYCMSAHDARARQLLCPDPFLPISPAKAQPSNSTLPSSSDSPPASATDASSHTFLRLDLRAQSKFNHFLQAVYPAIRDAEDGVHDTAYFSRRSRERSIGYSRSRFYDMDELRYALRSTLQFLRPLGTVHIISPDFPASALEGMAQAEANRTNRSVHDILKEHQPGWDRYVDPVDGSERVGQKPWWLDEQGEGVLVGAEALQRADFLAGGESGHGESAQFRQRPQLRLRHDWSLFRPLASLDSHETSSPAFSPERHTADVAAHKSSVLPTFNSMAVESALNPGTHVSAGGWAGTGASDTMLFSNDDFFLLRPLSYPDVHSPLYGLVLRFQHDLSVVFNEKSLSWASGGEWPGLKMAAQILDQRFGRREHRRYPMHVHRSVSAGLLHETRLMFREDCSAAMRARFRGTGTNLVNHFLLFNTIMERHREAALWSYISLVLDRDLDGQVDHHEFLALRQTFARHHVSKEDVLPGTDVSQAERAYRAAHPGWATELPSHHRSAERVLTPSRQTIDPRRIAEMHDHIGVESKGSPTQYIFSSWDGYALTDLYGNAVTLDEGADQGGKAEKWSEEVKPLFWHGKGWPWFLPIRSARTSPTSSKRLRSLGKRDQSNPGDLLERPRVDPTDAQDSAGRPATPLKEDLDLQSGIACTLKWKDCLAFSPGMDWMSANSTMREGRRWATDEVFTRMAFERPECGDCLLTHLVSQSGGSGLSTVLPAADVVLPRDDRHDAGQEGGRRPTAPEPQEPHLPLSRTWNTPAQHPSASRPGSPSAEAYGKRGANFTVSHIAHATGWAGRSARTFAARLLQRYAYVIASTPAEFARLEGGSTSRTKQMFDGILKDAKVGLFPSSTSPGKAGVQESGFDASDASLLEGDQTSLALLAVNDDIADHASAKPNMDIFTKWLEKTFPSSRWKTPFERS